MDQMLDGQLDPSPFSRLAVPRPADRYDYVSGRCRGRRVLDLGAYDETRADLAPTGRERWLHPEIASVASEILGVDASERLRSTGGITTRWDTRIVYGDVENLDAIIEDFKPDVIVAGELIEHTANTLGWISRLSTLAPGVDFVATTPNATFVANFVLGLLGRETGHPDHIHVYSYRTLATLAQRVPMHDIRVVPYYYDPNQFFVRVPRPTAAAVTLASGLLRGVQFLFPLTSCGLILDGVLGARPPS